MAVVTGNVTYVWRSNSFSLGQDLYCYTYICGMGQAAFMHNLHVLVSNCNSENLHNSNSHNILAVRLMLKYI